MSVQVLAPISEYRASEAHPASGATEKAGVLAPNFLLWLRQL